MNVDVMSYQRYGVEIDSATAECEFPCRNGNTIGFPVVYDRNFSGDYHVTCGRWSHG